MDTVPLRDSATEVVVVDNTAGLDDTVNVSEQNQILFL